MNTIARLKLIQNYLAIYGSLKTTSDVAKIKALKQARDILAELGYTQPENLQGNDVADTYTETETKKLGSLKIVALQNPHDTQLFLDSMVEIPQRDGGDSLLYNTLLLNISRTNSGLDMQFTGIKANETEAYINEVQENGKAVLGTIYNAKMGSLNEPILRQIEQQKKAMESVERAIFRVETQPLLEKACDEVGINALSDKISALRDDLSNLPHGDYHGEAEIYRQIDVLRKQISKLNKKRDERYLALLPDFAPYQELIARQQEIMNTFFAAGMQIIDKLNNQSLISQEQAQEWAAKSVVISKSAQSRLSKQGYSKEQILADAAAFYRLSNGRMSTVAIETDGSRRAFTHNNNAETSKATIFIDGNFTRGTLWHEMGHNLEFDPSAKELALNFIRRRRESMDLYKLRELTGNKGYGTDEVAYKDGWITPYIGKYYQERATEVFSMGLEYLSDPVSATIFLEKDRNMAEMIIGYLAKEKSELHDFVLQHAIAQESVKIADNQAKETAQAEKDNAAVFEFDTSELSDDTKETMRQYLAFIAPIRKGSRFLLHGTLTLGNSVYALYEFNAYRFSNYPKKKYGKRFVVSKFSTGGAYSTYTNIFNTKSESIEYLQEIKETERNNG